MPVEFGFLNALEVTGPIFIIIFIGFAVVRFGFFPREGISILGKFVINFALPSLLFKAIASRSISDIFNPEYLLAYGLGSLVAFSSALFIGMKLRKMALTKSTVLALGSSVSNSGFVGYPIVTQILGPVALVPFALTLIIENVVMLPLALSLADSGCARQKSFFSTLGETLARLAKNPLIISISLGLMVSALEVNIPVVANKVIDLFALSAGSISLFVIGGTLVGIKLRGMAFNVAQTVGLKLLWHPMAVIICILLLPDFDPHFQMAAVILASMPMMGIFPILGLKYQMETTCAAALLVATIVSFLTFSVFMWSFGYYSLFTQ